MRPYCVPLWSKLSQSEMENCNNPPWWRPWIQHLSVNQREYPIAAVLNTQLNGVIDCAILQNATGTRNEIEISILVFKLADDLLSKFPSVNYATVNVTLQLPELPNPPKVFCFKYLVTAISFFFWIKWNKIQFELKYIWCIVGQRPTTVSLKTTNFLFYQLQ